MRGEGVTTVTEDKGGGALGQRDRERETGQGDLRCRGLRSPTCSRNRTSLPRPSARSYRRSEGIRSVSLPSVVPRTGASVFSWSNAPTPLFPPPAGPFAPPAKEFEFFCTLHRPDAVQQLLGQMEATCSTYT